MNLDEIFLRRRSVRSYAEGEVSDDALENILRAGLSAPSSRGKQSVELIAVRSRVTLSALATAKASGSAMLSGASCAVVVIADGDRSDVWVEDCAVAMAHMYLKATDLGIGSCWVQCRLRDSSDAGVSSEEYVKNLLGIPEKYRVAAILSLGIPESLGESKSPSDADLSKLHREHF